MVSVRVPIIAVSVWIVVPISIIVRIPDTTWIVISIWVVGLSLVIVIREYIPFPTPHTAGIIVGGVSAAENPAGWEPDLLFVLIRLR
jgi:hypothetical protein